MQDHAHLLSLLPPETRRIHVNRENGEERWISPEELLDTDELFLRKDGIPEYMTGTPGRKKRDPLPPINEEVAQLMDLRNDAINTDALVKTVRENAQSDEVFSHVVAHLAEIAAVLRFERKEAERQGYNPTKMSTLINRQMAALKSVADTILKHKELTTDRSLDLEGPEFQVVFEFTLNTFRRCMEESGCRTEMIETVFSHFAHKLDADGWLEEAKNKVKKVQ